MDYVAGHPAAALVYRRGGHHVNLFVWPVGEKVGSKQPEGENRATANGYHVVRWSHAGLAYWAVTDADETAFSTVHPPRPIGAAVHGALT